MRLQYLLLLYTLTSCTMYNRDFDCPPPKGVCYAAVTTLEKMIVESSCGEDIFTGCVPKLPEKKPESSCKRARSYELPEPFQRRIWLASKGKRPVYIYFEEGMSCAED